MKRFLMIVWCAFFTVCMAMVTACAYLDPSVISYTISAVAGIAIACGAVFIVWWRKFRKKVSKKLGIDENAHKEVEDDVVITDDDSSEKKEDEDNGNN